MSERCACAELCEADLERVAGGGLKDPSPADQQKDLPPGRTPSPGVLPTSGGRFPYPGVTLPKLPMPRVPKLF